MSENTEACASRQLPAGEPEAPRTMILTYRVRLQPTKQQRRALEAILEQQRLLYNAALEERILAYAKGVSINENAQSKSLTLIRADDATFRAVQRRIQRGTLKRLDRSYQAFFRRAKQGAGASSGFPKFRARAQDAWPQALTGFGFEGFGFDAPAQIKFNGRRLYFAGMCGGLRVSQRDMRRVPPMTVDTWKGVHFKRTHAGWSVTFQVESQIVASRKGCGDGQVGVHWGTHYLATLSTGQIEHNPRPRETLAASLLRRERKVARRKKGSRRRLKSRHYKQAMERKIANRRRNRMDKLSQRLVKHYALVAGNEIAVRSMMKAERPGETLPQFIKTRRNREALDAAPYMLRQMIAYKSIRERAEFVAIDSKGIRDECFWCGGMHFKELADAVHTCTRPGLYFGMSAPRQVNSARINLKRALSPIAQGGDDGAGQGPAGGGKLPNRSQCSGRPKNTSGSRKTAADGLRHGQAVAPHTRVAQGAKDPRLRPLP